MSTFIEDETGLDSSNPIELIRFSGGLANYTYTSGNRQIDFHAPSALATETYKPIPVTRSEIVLGDVTERNELKINTGINLAIISDYAFNIAPTSDLTVEIYRQNGPAGAYQLIFAGLVAGIGIQGLKATITCPSVFTTYMDAEFPNIYYQSLCNHVLYSDRCGAVRADFTLTGTVSGIIDKTHITVEIAGTEPDDWLAVGEIDTATERRLILIHKGATLTLNYPFRDITVGMPVVLYAGCRHDIEVCNSKFNVKDNFLGWPYIPYINPFVVGIK